MLRQIFRCINSSSLYVPPRSINLAKYAIHQVSRRNFGEDLTAAWPESIKDFLKKENILSPTPIQEKTLPCAISNKDVVGIARTGSGKTLAFVIPAVMKILSSRNDKSAPDSKPSCLILAPTRELAAQTAQVMRKFRHLGITSIVLVGGSSRDSQVRDLGESEYDVLIATPGRLIDLIDSGIVSISKVKYLVLDEADRMLDMGFEPQLRKIVANIPKERQTLMWSATWPEDIQDLASEFMTDYDLIAVDSKDLKANPNIEQVIECCPGEEKHIKLLDFLRQSREGGERVRALIFTNTKSRAESLQVQLMRNRFRSVVMHGGRTQRARDEALKLFKTGVSNLMIASDVAARGLDIDDITHVINYDFPLNIQDYIHRIGRTARHDKKGISISYFTANDCGMAKKLIKVLQDNKQNIPEELYKLQDETIDAHYSKSRSFEPRRSYRFKMGDRSGTRW